MWLQGALLKMFTDQNASYVTATDAGVTAPAIPGLAQHQNLNPLEFYRTSKHRQQQQPQRQLQQQQQQQRHQHHQQQQQQLLQHKQQHSLFPPAVAPPAGAAVDAGANPGNASSKFSAPGACPALHTSGQSVAVKAASAPEAASEEAAAQKCAVVLRLSVRAEAVIELHALNDYYPVPVMEELLRCADDYKSQSHVSNPTCAFQLTTDRRTPVAPSRSPCAVALLHADTLDI